MTSERIQRRIDALLDEADQAMARLEWSTVRDRASAVLAADPDNADGKAYLEMAERGLGTVTAVAGGASPIIPPAMDTSQPTSFANGRYAVSKFLGEGGRKKVYLAHDTLLDRDVAFALIKTESLDEVGKERVTREAQAMGRLGEHPNNVSVYDIGEESGQPFVVLPLMPGGDVEGEIDKAPEHKLPLERALQIAIDTCQGLAFAHERGILHRDIKPGNVWLATDGRAQVGDWGLAVASDRTRLTQAGMMVGTPTYMPPEQAMGGETTARSDLYSLGAMLYEMVCGRPPFIGDDYVAVVSQHLNTPPVAPSWHRPECPPALEALILCLLEKSPDKRPASATEVLAALETIDKTPAGRQAAPSQATAAVSPHTHDPHYSRTFVGREPELKQLQTAFDAAMSGQGSLAMVVGEPGIGKTSLCEQLATYVTLRGGRALVGHCYEEGSLSLPYLPFVEVLRSYVLEREPDGLRSDLGSGAADVARIVSEIRDRVAVELRPAGDPEDDRWRLLQAVSGFLRNASAVQPMLIVLEDLHDADRGTLDLLLHVSRNLQGSRLLIVGTYRDVEVDRAHPLSGALAELRRGQAFQRVSLRGLTVDEVHRMYEAIRGNPVDWRRAEEVHRATEGNPLFVQEIIRYMVEEGLVVREGGRWVPAEGVGPSTAIPEGLRDVIGKRLSRLSEKANQALSVASVIGRDFRLDVLQQVLGAATGAGQSLTEDEVIEALEEAQERAIIEERPAASGSLVFRFTHALFRQILYEEIFAARRIRWHQQVARALEEVHARRLEEHAAELAEHFSHSTDPEDLRKAVEYAELAAQRAMSVYAYAEAERHLGQALKAQDVLDPDDKAKRCDLLLAMGEAMLPQENPGLVANTVASESFALAGSNGDSDRAARAALQSLEGLVRSGALTGSVEFQDWVGRADAHSKVGTAERVYADIYQGLMLLQTAGPGAMVGAIRRAAERAFALDDNSVFFTAAGWAIARLNNLQDIQLRERLAREVVTRPREGVRIRDLGLCLASAGAALLDAGDRTTAERASAELTELAANTHDVTLGSGASDHRVLFALVDGRLEQAQVLINANQARLQQLGTGIPTAFAPGPIAAKVALLLGRDIDAVTPPSEAPRQQQAVRAMLLSYLGHHDEVRAIRLRFGDIASNDDQSAAWVLVLLLEAAVRVGEEMTVTSLTRRLEPVANRLSSQAGLSFGRVLGEASAMANRPDEARDYYAQALEVCEKVRFRPEIALIRLDLAELLLEYYPEERDAAIEHLDSAITEFREMKMQPSLERALRHRGLLKA